MGGVISAVGGTVSSVLGGIGAGKAAKQQQKASDKAMDSQEAMYQQQLALMEPYRQAGGSALPGLQSLAGNPIDRNSLLSGYFQSPEYQQLSNQARYQQLAGSEATGGLGASSTSNALASIAPQLGQNYLGMMTDQQNSMYNQLLGLANVGLSGAGGQSAAAGNNASAMTNLLTQRGQINAGKAALPWQTASSVNQGAANGADNLLSSFFNMGGSF